MKLFVCSLLLAGAARLSLRDDRRSEGFLSRSGSGRTATNWEFAEDGLMRVRHASINEHPIAETDRKFRWPLGCRPDDHPGLSHFGF